MRILVTGSEGNIGRWLVPHLKQKHEVLRTCRTNIFEDDYWMVDVNTHADMVAAFSEFEPDVVLHMAGVVSRVTAERSAALTVKTNLVGTNNIALLCKRANSKLMYFSTSEVYGPTNGKMREDGPTGPNNLYGLTKLMGEQLVEHYRKYHGLNVLTVRPFMLYDEYETKGTHRSAMVRFAEALTKGKEVVVHKGARRGWLHMSDAVEIIERLIRADKYPIVNIGNPDVCSMHKIAKWMCEMTGASEELINVLDLPQQMTLVKDPDLARQSKLTSYTDFVPVKEGVWRLLQRMEREL